jgi:DNA-binding XRE family transcriptional regulator
VLVVRDASSWVLLDGYVRIAALTELARDLVDVAVLEVGETEALVLMRDISLETVARTLGISLVELLAICTGELDPDLEVVTRIAEAVGVKLSELFAEPTYN